MTRLSILSLALAAITLAPSASAQVCTDCEPPPVFKPDALLGLRAADVGGTTVPLPERSLNGIARALDAAVDLQVVVDKPAKMQMAYGLVRNGELVVSVTSDDLRATPGKHPLIRVGHGPVEGYEDPLFGIWGTGNVGYEDPLFGFDDPRLGYEEPLFGYEDPSVSYEDPLFGIWGDGDTYFDKPYLGYEDPLFGLDAVWGRAKELVGTEHALVLISYGLDGNRHTFAGSAIIVPFDLVDGAAPSDVRAPRASATATPALGVAPNPFAGGTTVTFETGEAGPVRVSLVDVLGREVAVVSEGERPAGAHRVRLDGAGLAPGPYLLRIAEGAAVRSVPVTVAR
ncbi:T9SS type A sorting domain-containing protein [Rubrivirga marina]|uniref:Secretion system C-terminal sorting domain-containing protein n=1 Tax=Rubrivirga marina TaxID=1196024 RepID=A0A271J471_9BACT|nr:T9SS type A sorting domain-containing protein [Rubrivirga marina]PAP77489.1 hypothetical protein BSZ37_14100 [Rubrivirga marina]